MDCRLLDDAELLIELEVRGMIDSSMSPEINGSLRKALSERVEVETFFTKPVYQHEAARRQPLHEVAKCQEKMQAVQKYMRLGLWAGVTYDEMLPWVNTKMQHVEGRLSRALWDDISSERAKKLYAIRNFLWEMMFLLEEGLVPISDIVEELSRFTFKIDTPVSEIDKVGISEAEVEVAKFAEEQVMEQEAEEQLEMKVEWLGEDELLVELEVRGLIDPTQGKITPKLKSALRRRLKEEKRELFTTPRWPHKAAKEQPEQEVAICQSKLRAVQGLLFSGIMNRIPLDEMFPQLSTSLLHINARLDRGCQCPIFRAEAMSLIISRDILWDMVRDLRRGQVSPDEVADKLFYGVVPWPKSEIGHVVFEEEEEEEEPEEEPIFSLDGETEAVEGEQVSEEVKKPEEEQIVSLDDEAEVVELENEQDSEEVEIIKVDEEKVEKNEIKSEEEEVKTAAEAVVPIKDDIGYPEKGYLVVSVRAPIQTIGDFGSRARDSRSRWQQDGSAGVRFKGLRCGGLITQFCAWIEWCAAHILTPVDRLLGVLDLRLEDEVLSKANRRVFRENVSGFLFVE